MTTENPKGFEDIDVAVLRKSAIEDFACDIRANANKQTVLAALLEDGVSWDDYATLKGLNAAPEPEPEAPVEVITAEEPQEVIIITKEEIPVTSVEKYLVKMTRENVRFDIRGHKFTKEHPYALVDAKDLKAIVEGEKGFRQAYPSELEEFYG